MTYFRVIPRDLFNEANLLKCLGQLYLLTERFSYVTLRMKDISTGFDIKQYSADGSIYADNVELVINYKKYLLHRPLNSREPWPLYATSPAGEETEVFTSDGQLSEAFLALI